MDSRHPNRRQLVLASVAAVTLHAAGRSLASAQTPVAADVNAVTTEIFGHEIAWRDPWMLDTTLPLTDETDLLDKESGEVVDTVMYDLVVLDHDDGAFGEMIFAPSPDDDREWEIGYRWPDIERYTSVESGSAAEFWYGLDFFLYEGAEYGRFVKGTYPEDGDHVSTVALTAPVAGFGDAMQAFLDDVTLDGAPPFANVDPAGLQAALDPLIGTGRSATPEATPAT